MSLRGDTLNSSLLASFVVVIIKMDAVDLEENIKMAVADASGTSEADITAHMTIRMSRDTGRRLQSGASSYVVTIADIPDEVSASMIQSNLRSGTAESIREFVGATNVRVDVGELQPKTLSFESVTGVDPDKDLDDWCVPFSEYCVSEDAAAALAVLLVVGFLGLCFCCCKKCCGKKQYPLPQPMSQPVMQQPMQLMSQPMMQQPMQPTGQPMMQPMQPISQPTNQTWAQNALNQPMMQQPMQPMSQPMDQTEAQSALNPVAAN